MVPWPPVHDRRSAAVHPLACASSNSSVTAGLSSMPAMTSSEPGTATPGLAAAEENQANGTESSILHPDEDAAELASMREKKSRDEVLLGLRLEDLGLKQLPAEVACARPQAMAEGEFSIISQRDIPEGARVVKSLIWEYVAGSSPEATPIAVVLEVDRIVCKQEMAAAIARWVSRRSGEAIDAADISVGLMPREAAVEYGGYTMGNVGPFGHANPMPLIVDSRLLAKGGATSDIYAGGGADGFELRVNLQSVMTCAETVIGPISIGNGGQSPKRAPNSRQKKQGNTDSAPRSQQRGKDATGGTIPTASAIRKHACKPEATEDLIAILAGLDDPAEVLNRGTDQSGKTALQLAAWRGSVDSVRVLLDAGADIDAYSTGMGNYGKSAIFYALTRCRDEMVELLLEKGASVLICNNKGQTPLSVAVSHVKPETVRAIEEAEARQLAAGGTWLNFRETHSDGKSYGDLDPRMGLDAANGFTEPVEGVQSVRPTSIQSRRERWEKRRINSQASNAAAASPSKQAETGYPDPSPGPRPALPTLTVGTSLCHLVGIVTSKRRIGKALMFVNLVPPPDPNVPETCAPFLGNADPTTANKFAWHDASRNPEDCTAGAPPGVAVQLIIGRTVKERVGFEAAVEILRSIRVGQLVYTTGRMWINGERGQRNYLENSTVDIVVSDIRVLQENYRVVPVPNGAGASPGASSTALSSAGFGEQGSSDRASKGLPPYKAAECLPATLSDVLGPVVDQVPSTGAGSSDTSAADPRILMVDTPEAIEALRNAVRGVRDEVKAGGAPAGRCCVAIDCEWEPGPRGGDGNPVALLQLAVSSRVFLVDLQTLCRPRLDASEDMTECEAQVSSCIREIFSDKRIPVVGFGLRTDLQKLAWSFPHMPCFKAVESIVDLKALLTAIFPGSPHMAQSIGLSKLCVRLIGKRLDKTEQCSDWTARPLSMSQMNYAALDAAVLLTLLAPMAQQSGMCRCEAKECVQCCVFDSGNGSDIRRSWTASEGSR